MTMQEMLDNAWFGLQKQNKPAFDTYTGWCCLRDRHGNKCAVGHSIPDNRYSEELEEVGITTLNKHFFHIDSDLFLGDLRETHDYCIYQENFWECVKTHLKILAKEYNLSVPGALNE